MLSLLTLDDARSQDMHKLDEVQRQLEKSRERETALTRQAKELEQEVAALRREMIQAARAAQEHEALLSSLEGRLDDLRADAAAREEALKRRRRQMIGTLAALTRLSRNAPEALLPIGRASCRERGGKYGETLVGGVTHKKTKNK